MHGIAEVIRRYRQLWATFCWLVAAFMLILGLVYLVFGLHATSVPGAFRAMTEGLPGGLRTYGGIVALTGAALVHGLSNALHRGESMRDEYLHAALPYAYGTAAGAFIMWTTSWALSGVMSWVPLLYWSAIGGFAFALWKLPPYPPDSPRAA